MQLAALIGPLQISTVETWNRITETYSGRGPCPTLSLPITLASFGGGPQREKASLRTRYHI